MNEINKINLSAMMKKPWEKENNNKSQAISQKSLEENLSPIIPSNSSEENKVEISNNEKVHSGITINIDSIKSEHVEEEIIEEVKKEVVKDKQTLFYESLTSNVLWNSKDNVWEKVEKINETSLKKSWDNIDWNKWWDESCSFIEDKEWEKKEICNIQQHNISEHEKNDVFLNYESDYKKKESRIIETIHSLKKIADLKKLTKTNKIFVVSIIMITVLWISVIFYIDPETHSLENYKTSILTIAGREVTHQELILHQNNIENNIIWQLNQNNLWWYQLDFEILTNDNWEAIYKFENLEYRTKELLDIAITEKLEFLKKEKIKNYLKQ